MDSPRTERSTTDAWKQLTMQGNVLFDAGDLHAALERSEHARALVMQAFSARRHKRCARCMGGLVRAATDVSLTRARHPLTTRPMD